MYVLLYNMMLYWQKNRGIRTPTVDRIDRNTELTFQEGLNHWLILPYDRASNL